MKECAFCEYVVPRKDELSGTDIMELGCDITPKYMFKNDIGDEMFCCDGHYHMIDLGGFGPAIGVVEVWRLQ